MLFCKENKKSILEFLILLRNWIVSSSCSLWCFFFFSFVYLIQKLKTHVIKQSVNPEWNDDLTLSVTDPNQPIKLVSDPYVFV